MFLPLSIPRLRGAPPDFLADYVTPPVQGELEHVALRFADGTTEAAQVEIWTSMGESIVRREGGTDILLYPRNWGVWSEANANVSVAPEGAWTPEKYVVYGPLLVRFTGAGPTDALAGAHLLVRGDVLPYQAEVLQKTAFRQAQDAAVAAYLAKVSVGVGGGPLTITPAMRGTLWAALFPGIFSRFSGAQSEAIKLYLLRALVAERGVPEMVQDVARLVQADPESVETLVRTEVAAARHAVKETAYQALRGAEDAVYAWRGPDDARTTPACQTILRESRDGLPLEDLKALVREEGQKMMGPGWIQRDWSPHPSCRHTFVRVLA